MTESRNEKSELGYVLKLESLQTLSGERSDFLINASKNNWNYSVQLTMKNFFTFLSNSNTKGRLSWLMRVVNVGVKMQLRL